MKNKIKIKFDVANEVRQASRKFFKNKQKGSFAHKNKKAYTRKAKNKTRTIGDNNSAGFLFY